VPGYRPVPSREYRSASLSLSSYSVEVASTASGVDGMPGREKKGILLHLFTTFHPGVNSGLVSRVHLSPLTEVSNRAREINWICTDSQAYTSPGTTVGPASPLFSARSPPMSNYAFSPSNGSIVGDSHLPALQAMFAIPPICRGEVLNQPGYRNSKPSLIHRSLQDTSC
jgi:hypothetical protein